MEGIENEAIYIIQQVLAQQGFFGSGQDQLLNELIYSTKQDRISLSAGSIVNGTDGMGLTDSRGTHDQDIESVLDKTVAGKPTKLLFVQAPVDPGVGVFHR